MSKAGEWHSLPVSDVAEPMVSVTDVKHYVFISAPFSLSEGSLLKKRKFSGPGQLIPK